MEPVQQISQAKEAIQQMNFTKARELLTDLVASDSQNIEAWILLARVSLERQDAIHCLEHVLSLDPNHRPAKEMLDQFQFTSETRRRHKWPSFPQKKSNPNPSSVVSDQTTKAPQLILGPIIGGLTDSSVNLWGRTSGPAILYAWVSKKSPLKPYLAGRKSLGIENGYSGAIEVTSLAAQTEYCYAINLTSEPPLSSDFNTFKTAPLKGRTFSFQFAFGSCFRPTDPGAHGMIFKRVLDSHPDLSFMIMLGDQIYADNWKRNGLARVAVNIDDYREVYRHTWTNPHLRKFFNHTPVFMTMDDHEVDNDWHWCDAKKTLAEIPIYTQFFRWALRRPLEERELSYHRVQAGLQAYWEHQGIHAPAPLGRNPASEGCDKSDDTSAGPFSYKFEFGAVGFFVMDTRSQRVYSAEQRVVLDEDQWRDLEQWLIESNEKFPVKFIVTSSSLLTIMLGDFTKDRWSSFPDERDRLLRMISKHGINGVYFLTGDLHSAHAISANLKNGSGQTVKIWEFCSSPFEQATNFLASLITRKHPKHRLWEAYKVHFIVKRNNYGVVTVYFNDPDHPSVHFDLHYQTRKGTWKTKSVSNLQQ